jgi:asparagine N-glycosylation enzyme membrane subunit Stt3
MRENLPEDAVVAAWWDHGYWITAVANRRTLADNGTINGTQIAQIAEMFMSNESQALPILKRYETTHVVVFTTFYLALEAQQPLLYGYEVRWTWMAKIAGLNETELGDTSITRQLGFGQLSIPKRDILLTKLMIHGTFPEYALLYFGITLEHFDLVFSSSNRMVLVYEVKYD